MANFPTNPNTLIVIFRANVIKIRSSYLENGSSNITISAKGVYITVYLIKIGKRPIFEPCNKAWKKKNFILVPTENLISQLRLGQNL